MDARTELADAAGLPFATAARCADCVEGVHRAVAGRVFGVLGTAAEPVRLAHDGTATVVYRSIRAASEVLGRSARLSTRLVPRHRHELSQWAPAGRLVAALNGAVGDRLRSGGSGLAIRMAIRSEDRDVPADAGALARAFPRPTSRIAVFVHGLGGNEHGWDARSGGAGEISPGYGDRLRADLGCTPLFLRYNTGLHVAENGRLLSELLEDVVEAWPAAVEEIVLVGHSMGGLVVRSACHHGRLSSARWTAAARHVVCLGAPHLGAPLERGADVVGHLLRLAPETRPFAELLNGRSAGIKDLRSGSIAAADRLDEDPDAPLPGVACYAVCATVTSDPRHPLGRLVGDLAVPATSASGQGWSRRVPFEPERRCSLGGLHHMDLLNHPRVYAQMRRWLESASER